MRDAIADEVKRYVSPKTLYTLMSLVIAMLLAVVMLWMQNNTQAAWITVLNGEVKALKSVSVISKQLDEVNGTITALEKAIATTEEEDDE